MKGWTPDGREVELSPQQESQVRALVAGSHSPAADEAWSAVLHTAVRYDGLRRGIPLNDPAYDAIPARLAGRTQASGACNRGSNPWPGATPQREASSERA